MFISDAQVAALDARDSRAVARTLLMQVLGALLPLGEVVLGVDDTIERRWGIRIKARGLYRDPVRPRTATSSGPAACAGCRIAVLSA